MGKPKAKATKADVSESKENRTPEELKDIGNKAFASGNFSAALDAFTKAIDLDPKNHVFYSNRSATNAALKNFEAALKDAEQCISLNPQWAKGFLRKGAALEGLYKYPESMKAYQKGLSLDANDANLQLAAKNMQAVLDELNLQLEPVISSNDDSDRFDMLVHWLHEGGCKFDKLYLRYYSQDYRGVHSLAKISSDEVILYVPLKMIMTSEVAKESDIGTKLIKSGYEVRSKHSYLAVFLLQEKKKGKESFWYPYINSLPQKYENMPIFFDQQKLDLLKGSFTIAKINDRIDSLKKEYEGICEAVPEFRQYSHEDFVWARLVVITRIFGLVINGNKTDGLVAYADMLNHKKPKDAGDTDTRWTFDDKVQGFTITSTKSIARGEQVYDSYGRKCNSRFFVNYGFALDENEDDNEAVLTFDPNLNDPLFALKQRLCGGRRDLLMRKEFQIPGHYRETSEREKKTKEMFSWVRLQEATDKDVLLLQEGKEFKIDDIDPLSVDNEIAVLKRVKAAAQHALSLFPNTLEEDIELLKKNEFPDSNYRNCIVMRRGEKQVLRWFIEVADTCIPLLQMPWANLKRAVAKSFNSSNSPTDHFIREVVVPLCKRQGM